MRTTPGLVGGAGIAAGLMFLLGRQRGKHGRPALPIAANLAADAVAGARQAIARANAPRRVTDLADAARRLRPQWRDGRITLRHHRRATFLEEHPWAVVGTAASVLAAGMWGLRRREAGKMRIATTIDAPIERVFDACSRFEDFRQFVPMVAEVRPDGDDGWQWTIANPGGEPIQLVSRVTQRERPYLIAWATEGAVAQHSGTARFRPKGESQTRMKIEISRPASSGAAREGVAAMTGLDPERALRDGIAAFKARVEAAHQSV